MTTTRMTRQETAAQTRVRLVAGAAEVFAEKGFFGASVEGIAERAGFTRGAFYRNFADKSEIFLALLDERTQTGVDEIRRIMVEAATPAEVFAGLRARAVARPVDQSWLMLTTEFWLYAMRHPEVRPKLAARQRAIRRQYERGIAGLYSSVNLDPPAHAKDLALILQVLDEGVVTQQSIDPAGIRRTFFPDALTLLFEASAALSREQAVAPSAD